MHKSETTKQIDAALFEVQKASIAAIKDRKNDHLKSKYATLNAVWEACRDPLVANQILVTQAPTPHDRGVSVVTRLVHVPSGEWLSSELAIPVEKMTPQAIGSAITYARRYALAAMVNVLVEDDDAEGAMGRGQNGRHDPPTRAAEQPKAQPAKVADRKQIDAAIAAIRGAKTADALHDLASKLDQVFPKGSPFRDEALSEYDRRDSELKRAAA